MPEKPHIVIFAKDGAGWLGGRQYCVNLVRALVAHRGDSQAFDISVLVKGADELDHYESLRPQLRHAVDFVPLLQPWSLGNRLRWKFKRTVRGWTNPRFEELLLAMGATYVYPFSSAIVASGDWISDFQYSYFPDRMSRQEVLDREAEFSGIVRHAQTVVLSSHCAQRDCVRLFPKSQGRTAVLQFRVFADPQWVAQDSEATRLKYHLPSRFALVSNWLLPTKNHALILDALARIPAKRRAAIHIVCTGDIYDYRNPGFYNLFLSRIHTLGLHDNISVLGVIPKSDQIQLLRSAEAYLQPSLFEGWNTGVEEARLFGRPILLSDIPVHREQDPPGAVFFDPRDANDLAARLDSFFNSPTPENNRLETERVAFDAYAGLQREFGRTLVAISRGKS